ncbi:hypothetical protein SAY87_003426 [Trapa incisa]|uniref:Uncharacterized protein n=1 Tax=Trapa incisa TaxID=236973 RepID=A0AAN7KKK1_9MYRT|nr:hypothetical protein SAY87_003426 [Trapa incisa]
MLLQQGNLIRTVLIGIEFKKVERICSRSLVLVLLDSSILVTGNHLYCEVDLLSSIGLSIVRLHLRLVISMQLLSGCDDVGHFHHQIFLFSVRYYENQNLKVAFEGAPTDPTVDLNTKLKKMMEIPQQREAGRDTLRMFKTVIAASHPAFSTMRQQEGWCDSLGSVEEIQSKLLKRQEAAARRERAMAYALAHQWQAGSRQQGAPEMNQSAPNKLKPKPSTDTAAEVSSRPVIDVPC